MSDRWMRAAEALLPPGDQVVECIGVTAGPNPDVIAGLVLAGLVVIEVAAFLIRGDEIPTAVLLLIVAVSLPLLFRARGVVVSQHGRWLAGWGAYEGLKGPLEPLGAVALDRVRRRFWRIPVLNDGETLWFTPSQLRRLTAAGVPVEGLADAKGSA